MSTGSVAEPCQVVEMNRVAESYLIVQVLQVAEPYLAGETLWVAEPYLDGETLRVAEPLACCRNLPALHLTLTALISWQNKATMASYQGVEH